MASPSTDDEFAHLQDVLGTLPMVKRYIAITLCFAIDAGTSTSRVETALAAALAQLGSALPFLRGRVVFDGRTGTPRVVRHRDGIELVVKDLRAGVSKFPSMAELRGARYPFAMLDATTLAPGIATAWSADDASGAVAPVLVVQANVVDGGLLLLFAGNHTQMDMTGLGMIMALFAKACRGEPFTEEEIAQGNQPRGGVVPLLGDDYEAGPELHDVLIGMDAASTLSQSDDDGLTAPPPRWAYFEFTAESLSRLKSEASRQDLVPYISTDDAVSALCWQRITKIRESRLGPYVRTNFARPLSVRRYLDLKGYMGHMVDVVYDDEVDVWKSPLGEVAGRLRRILLQDDKIRHHVRAYATILKRLEDKSKMVNGAHLDPARDVILSSYANIRCCELSFGPILGKPEEARRPDMPAAPSLLYLMPKSKSGSIAVAFCLREDDLEKLRHDDVFTSFADYVG